MALSGAALKRDLSRTELGLVILALVILVALFFDRLGEVEVAAEEAMLVTQRQNMQARGLELRLEIMTGDAADRPQTLDDVMHKIAPDETLFAAREAIIDWSSIAAGRWVYVSDRQRLLYRTLNGLAVQDADGEPPRVTFQVSPIFADNGSGEAHTGRLTGARVTRMLREQAP